MHLTPQIDIISKSTNSPNDPISTISEISSPNFIKSNTNSKNPYHDLNLFFPTSPNNSKPTISSLLLIEYNTNKIIKRTEKKGGA
jgi:hypothetical protein